MRRPLWPPRRWCGCRRATWVGEPTCIGINLTFLTQHCTLQQRSREVKTLCHLISSHPPRRRLGRPSSEQSPRHDRSSFCPLAATPRSWSGGTESDDRLRSISCTSPPAMVFHRHPLGHELSPRPMSRPQKRVVKPSLASHTRDLRDLFQTSKGLLMPRLVFCVCQPSTHLATSQ